MVDKRKLDSTVHKFSLEQQILKFDVCTHRVNSLEATPCRTWSYSWEMGRLVDEIQVMLKFKA